MLICPDMDSWTVGNSTLDGLFDYFSGTGLGRLLGYVMRSEECHCSDNRANIC